MICPNCGFVSYEGFPKCPQCGKVTASGDRCGNCGGSIESETSIYCPACGAVNTSRQSEDILVCDSHVENRAIGLCVVCGRAVCEDCAETLGTKIICQDPNHRVYADSWRVIYSFDFEYEAAMLYANLEQQDVESEVFSKPNPNSSETSFRPTIVEVIVPSGKFEKAQEIARTLGLAEDDISEDPSGEGEA